jgi:deoxyribose-phosphate aldolase
VALMDLTELGDSAGEDAVLDLCRKASGGEGVPPVAAVCVWPRHVTTARGALPAAQGRTGERVRIATVINFPAGDGTSAMAAAGAHGALLNGADEIDLVMPYKAFLKGDTATAEAMIRAVRAVVPAGKRLKVILETGAYPDQQAVRAASALAIAAGADFIKTSTGKIAVGATLDAARTMLEAIRDSGRAIGFKPAGGIRTLADAQAHLALADAIMGPGWARPETFRFGASGLLAALAGVITGTGAAAGKGY